MKESTLKFPYLLLIIFALLQVKAQARVVCEDFLKYNPKSDYYEADDLPDFTIFRNSITKKKRFLDFMFLIIDSENSKILTSREKLIKIKSENNLTKTQFAFINNLEEMYRLKKSRKQEDIKWNSLLSRVDIIPVELALAQAACESGWGTSGFAQRANNLFGHWTYKQGSGIVPDKREEGATHEIEIFRTVNSSVQKYMRNLNSNSAYYELRVLRKEMRKQERRIEGLVLSKGLKLYSGVGEKYIKTIDSIIKHNIKLMGR